MRVVVTGIGIVSPLGRGARTTMDRLLAAERAIRPLTLFEVSGLRTNLAAEVADLAAARVRDEAGGDGPWSRADAMAVLAAREALEHARVPAAGAPMELFLGGSTGGMFECEVSLAALKRDVSADVERAVLKAHPLSASSDRIHEVLGPFAHTTAVCSACSGGATAILLAASAIRNGRAERALAGGVDALCRLTYAGFAALGAVDDEPCRPFDVRRGGLSLGEGAAFVVLESEAAARSRGREPLAELAGWAIASEAHHITHPQPTGATAAAVMAQAIADAGLSLADVDYVNAHGTATPHNDPMEAAAIRGCFGERTPEVWVSSIKGSIGHTLGAAGAIEAAVTTLVVSDGAIPPTAGLVEAADALRHVERAVRAPVRAAVSNAFGFGGTDTALVFSAGERARPAPAPAPRLAITGAACIGPLGFFGGDTLAAMAAYAEPGPLPPDERCSWEPGILEMMAARRLDRASRLATMVAQAALGASPDPATGVVVGTAHGGVTATTEVVRRMFEKGARYASPVHFPCVLPSAIASHASIYLGLTGPAFACSDLSTSAEAAFAVALDLVRDGLAPRVVAAAVDEHNEVAAKVSAPIACDIPDRGARAEGAAALLIEPLAEAGARALAEVVWGASWRGDEPSIPPPTGAGQVCLARAGRVPAAWAALPRYVVADRAGDHESVGGAALVTAVSAIASQRAAEVLVIGRGPDRGYAWILRAPA